MPMLLAKTSTRSFLRPGCRMADNGEIICRGYVRGRKRMTIDYEVQPYAERERMVDTGSRNYVRGFYLIGAVFGCPSQRRRPLGICCDSESVHRLGVVLLPRRVSANPREQFQRPRGSNCSLSTAVSVDLERHRGSLPGRLRREAGADEGVAGRRVTIQHIARTDRISERMTAPHRLCRMHSCARTVGALRFCFC